MKRTFHLNNNDIRHRAAAACMTAPEGYQVIVKEPARTLDQNAKIWPMLHDLAQQVEWYGHKLTPEEWKDLMTAGLKKQRAVPGIDGGFVVIGAHTSKMSKSEFSDLVEMLYAFGAEHGVKWSEPEARV